MVKRSIIAALKKWNASMCMLDEIRARCACRGAIRSPEVAKQRAATRSQEAARDEIYAVARAHKAEKLCVFGFVHIKRRGYEWA